MPQVTIIDNRGASHTIEAKAGTTLMQAVLHNQIEGVVAECGGSCACGTCHCYVDETWASRLPARSDIEQETLECSIGVQDTSRLSCQIQLTDQMDGLLVRLPDRQV
jgi:2Fe-2S ferredoxin